MSYIRRWRVVLSWLSRTPPWIRKDVRSAIISRAINLVIDVLPQMFG